MKKWRSAAANWLSNSYNHKPQSHPQPEEDFLKKHTDQSWRDDIEQGAFVQTQNTPIQIEAIDL